MAEEQKEKDNHLRFQLVSPNARRWEREREGAWTERGKDGRFRGTVKRRNPNTNTHTQKSWEKGGSEKKGELKHSTNRPFMGHSSSWGYRGKIFTLPPDLRSSSVCYWGVGRKLSVKWGMIPHDTKASPRLPPEDVEIKLSFITKLTSSSVEQSTRVCVRARVYLLKHVLFPKPYFSNRMSFGRLPDRARTFVFPITPLHGWKWKGGS